MRIFTCFATALLLSLCTVAQHIPTDVQQLIASSKKDTVLVNRLNEEILNGLIYKSPKQAIKLAEYIDSLSKQLRFRKGEARALDLMGDALLRDYNYPRSFEVQIQSLKINEEIGEVGAVAGCMISLSQLFGAQGDQATQIQYLFAADSIARKVKDTVRILYCLQNLGNIYRGMKRYDTALVMLQEAYAISMKKPTLLTSVLLPLSDLHQAMGNMDLAWTYHRMAEAEALKAQDYLTLYSVYYGYTYYYISTKKTDSAFYYCKKGFDMALANQHAQWMLYFGRHYETLYKDIDPQKSMYYHKLADSIYFTQVNSEKNGLLASMLENEKLRQSKLQAERLAAAKERKTSLQFTIIFITIISAFVLFMVLSHSTIASQRLIRFLGVLVLLVLFEFINLVLHPYLGELTHHSPVLMLLIMVTIAALLIPLHHKLEHWITHRLVEKNKKIRLSAAKKIIQQLESEANPTM